MKVTRKDSVGEMRKVIVNANKAQEPFVAGGINMNEHEWEKVLVILTG